MVRAKKSVQNQMKIEPDRFHFNSNVMSSPKKFPSSTKSSNFQQKSSDTEKTARNMQNYPKLREVIGNFLYATPG
jgi:hypothetical protein